MEETVYKINFVVEGVLTISATSGKAARQEAYDNLTKRLKASGGKGLIWDVMKVGVRKCK